MAWLVQAAVAFEIGKVLAAAGAVISAGADRHADDIGDLPGPVIGLASIDFARVFFIRSTIGPQQAKSARHVAHVHIIAAPSVQPVCLAADSFIVLACFGPPAKGLHVPGSAFVPLLIHPVLPHCLDELILQSGYLVSVSDLGSQVSGLFAILLGEFFALFLYRIRIGHEPVEIAFVHVCVDHVITPLPIFFLQLLSYQAQLMFSRGVGSVAEKLYDALDVPGALIIGTLGTIAFVLIVIVIFTACSVGEIHLELKAHSHFLCSIALGPTFQGTRAHVHFSELFVAGLDAFQEILQILHQQLGMALAIGLESQLVGLPSGLARLHIPGQGHAESGITRLPSGGYVARRFLDVVGGVGFLSGSWIMRSGIYVCGV